MLQKMAWLAFAGALGTLSRYGLGNWIQRLHGGPFPWGTWVVNCLGCFLFGFVWSLAEGRWYVDSGNRLLVLVGFMGAFTTFSTYLFDTQRMLEGSQWLWVAGNLLGQNAAGLAALVVGSYLARVL